MYPSQSFPALVSTDRIPYVAADESVLSAARAAVDAVAERNAVLRLLATAEVIRDSMSIADQPSLHARLRSDIEGLKRFGFGVKS